MPTNSAPTARCHVSHPVWLISSAPSNRTVKSRFIIHLLGRFARVQASLAASHVLEAACRRIMRQRSVGGASAMEWAVKCGRPLGRGARFALGGCDGWLRRRAADDFGGPPTHQPVHHKRNGHRPHGDHSAARGRASDGFARSQGGPDARKTDIAVGVFAQRRRPRHRDACFPPTRRPSSRHRVSAKFVQQLRDASGTLKRCFGRQGICRGIGRAAPAVRVAGQTHGAPQSGLPRVRDDASV